MRGTVAKRLLREACKLQDVDLKTYKAARSSEKIGDRKLAHMVARQKRELKRRFKRMLRGLSA